MSFGDVMLALLAPNPVVKASKLEVLTNETKRPKQADIPKLPLDGLYVVAAFETLSKNRLQNWGRRLYYRNPERYHFLLPSLGYTPRPDVPVGRQPITRAPKPTVK